MKLTDAGRLLYEQALQVLGRVDQMKDATRRVDMNRNRVLSIGFELCPKVGDGLIKWLGRAEESTLPPQGVANAAKRGNGYHHRQPEPHRGSTEFGMNPLHLPIPKDL